MDDLRNIKSFPSFLPGSEVSMREESDNDQNQSDEGDTETSPTKSPTTPKSVKSKNSSGIIHRPETTGQFQDMYHPGGEKVAGQAEERPVGVTPAVL